MKIALFSRVLYLSGVTTHIIDLTKELIDRGHYVYIFTRGEEYPNKSENVALKNKLMEVGAKIVYIPFGYNYRNIINYLFKMILSISKVNKALKEYEIEIIHVHTPSLSFIPKVLGRKFVKTIHLKNMSIPILNVKATHEITISRETYIEAKNKYNYSEDDLSLIFNGVNRMFSLIPDEHSKESIKKKLMIPYDKTIIGIVGTIQYRKGHDILLKAIQLLNLEQKEKIHIIILGDGNNEEINWLNKLLRDTNLIFQTSIFKFQDPKPFYDIIDIFVLPSRLEGFPLVSIEAFLSQCCVVRSNVEGAYDQIEDKISGFLFKSEGINELKEVLEYLLLNKTKRIEVAIKGRDRALLNFTSDIMVEKTLKVYNRILSI